MIHLFTWQRKVTLSAHIVGLNDLKGQAGQAEINNGK